MKKLIVNYEDGTQRSYTTNTMMDALKMLARLEATNEKVYTTNHIKNYRIEKAN